MLKTNKLDALYATAYVQCRLQRTELIDELTGDDIVRSTVYALLKDPKAARKSRLTVIIAQQMVRVFGITYEEAEAFLYYEIIPDSFIHFDRREDKG